MFVKHNFCPDLWISHPAKGRIRVFRFLSAGEGRAARSSPFVFRRERPL